MITVHFKDVGRIEENISPQELKHLNADDILWIDLTAPTLTERGSVEALIGRKLLTREQAEEIESSSKFSETSNAIISNADYYIDKGKTYHSEPVSFIISRQGFLVSLHQIFLDALNETARRIDMSPSENISGYHVFITVLESLIDYEADMEEVITKQISHLSKDITSSKNIDKNVLHRINVLQEKCTTLREDNFDLKRLLSGIQRSHRFPDDIQGRLNLMIKDVDSLINHGDISFSRLDYLQDTALGLINIEQNEIVKILSVAAVIFMPPTLIASMYGMNFKVMPELDWTIPMKNGWIIPAGYIFAIFLMVLVSVLTYRYFRYKKWL